MPPPVICMAVLLVSGQSGSRWVGGVGREWLVWGGALREHWCALAHADAYSEFDESKIELAREGRQI